MIKPSEFHAVYNALAQWADNERGREDEERTPKEQEQLALVEGVVECMELVFTSLTDAPEGEAQRTYLRSTQLPGEW